MANKKRFRSKDQKESNVQQQIATVGKKRNMTPETATHTKRLKPGEPTSSSVNDSWLSSLVKTAAQTDTTSSNAIAVSKTERLERRAAKQARRQARRGGSSQQQNQQGTSSLSSSKKVETKTKQQQGHHPTTKHRLLLLINTLKSIGRSLATREGRPIPYKAEILKRKKAHWDPTTIQPRSCDYGGIGLARESLWISFEDPSLFPKLEQEFQEHIPGFFGKQRTKAMKKQMSKNMLWRQCLETKNSNKKLGGKKLADMTADERVKAMMNSGMI